MSGYLTPFLLDTLLTGGGVCGGDDRPGGWLAL